jgi:hypothetical protein
MTEFKNTYSLGAHDFYVSKGTGGASNLAVSISTAANLIIAGSKTDNNAFVQTAANTTTNASLFLAGSTADVSSPTNGMAWYNSTAHTLNFRDNGITTNLLAVAGANVFTQTADLTLTNSAIQTTIIGTGIGSSTIAANTLVAGKTVRMHGYGYLTTAASAPTLSISVGFQSALSSISVAGITSTMSFVPMEWDVELTIRTAGSSGAFQVNGWVSVAGTKSYIASAGTGTVNTTTTQTADIQATFGTADVNNTIVTKFHRLSFQ